MSITSHILSVSVFLSTLFAFTFIFLPICARVFALVSVEFLHVVLVVVSYA